LAFGRLPMAFFSLASRFTVHRLPFTFLNGLFALFFTLSTFFSISTRYNLSESIIFIESIQFSERKNPEKVKDYFAHVLKTFYRLTFLFQRPQAGRAHTFFLQQKKVSKKCRRCRKSAKK